MSAEENNQPDATYSAENTLANGPAQAFPNRIIEAGNVTSAHQCSKYAYERLKVGTMDRMLEVEPIVNVSPLYLRVVRIVSRKLVDSTVDIITKLFTRKRDLVPIYFGEINTSGAESGPHYF